MCPYYEVNKTEYLASIFILKGDNAGKDILFPVHNMKQNKPLPTLASMSKRILPHVCFF